MKSVFFAVFLISGIIHLYASLKQDKRMRAYSKVFILLGLLGWYCVSAQNIRWIVVAAIAFSWLGDVLLIPKGVKWFTLGGISFMVSHLCFVFSYKPQVDFSSFPIVIAIIAAAVYFCAVCLVFKGLKTWLPKALFYPMFLYLLINGTMNCFAFYQLMSMPCAASIITFVGAMLFFSSDSILFYVRFKKDTMWKTHFPVMLTYIIAEYMIVLGLIMIG